VRVSAWRSSVGRAFRVVRRTLRAACLAALAVVAATTARAATAPVEPRQAAPLPPSPERSTEDLYRAIIRSLAVRTPVDTLGNGLFQQAQEAFYAGRFDAASAICKDFTQRYTRNLNVDDALEIMLWIRSYRDFDGEPLHAYARMLGYRAAGQPDSAEVVGRAALARYPGAAVRYHIELQLAELASARGDHKAALTYASAVADTSAKSRLAPFALKLAGDEAQAAGLGLDQALQFYEAILLRYPNSPLAPEMRVQVMQMRKKLQL
jgi:tetratricopeptide (TPR) repeat protein